MTLSPTYAALPCTQLFKVQVRNRKEELSSAEGSTLVQHQDEAGKQLHHFGPEHHRAGQVLLKSVKARLF